MAMNTNEFLSTEGLYQLMSWLSPSYPVGAYTYSHGIEYAVDAGWVETAGDTKEWVTHIVTDGDGHTDAVLLAHAYRAADDETALAELLEFANAFIPTKELAMESTNQGGAFLDITEQAWPCGALDRLRKVADGPVPYPIGVGVSAAGQIVPLKETAHAYLHAFAANMVSAAVRLIPLGQTDGQLITASLATIIPKVVKSALETGLDDLATNTFLADIGSMKHETQYTRLFRS